MIAIGNYSGATNLLVENQRLFRAGNLTRYGLQQVDLYEFTVDKTNPYLTEEIAMFLYKNGQLSEAFRFLMLMMNQGVSAKQVKALQENLGKALAKSDLAANPDENKLLALRKYPVENNWFSVFSEAYSGEWELLKQPIPANPSRTNGR